MPAPVPSLSAACPTLRRLLGLWVNRSAPLGRGPTSPRCVSSNPATYTGARSGKPLPGRPPPSVAHAGPALFSITKPSLGPTSPSLLPFTVKAFERISCTHSFDLLFPLNLLVRLSSASPTKMLCSLDAVRVEGLLIPPPTEGAPRTGHSCFCPPLTDPRGKDNPVSLEGAPRRGQPAASCLSLRASLPPGTFSAAPLDFCC